MPKFQIQESHDVGQADASARVRASIDAFQKEHGSLVDSVKWDADGLGGSAKGRGYTVKFSITDSDVTAQVDLSFVLSALKGKISSKLSEKIRKALS